MQTGKRRHHLQFVLIKRKMIFWTGEITNDLMPLKRCFSMKWYSYIFSNDLSVFSDPTIYPPWGLPNIIEDCFCQYHWIEINIRKHPLEKSSQLLRFWLFWSIMHGSKAGFKHCSIEMLFSLEKIAAVCRSRRIIQSICSAEPLNFHSCVCQRTANNDCSFEIQFHQHLQRIKLNQEWARCLANNCGKCPMYAYAWWWKTAISYQLRLILND